MLINTNLTQDFGIFNPGLENINIKAEIPEPGTIIIHPQSLCQE